jgi:ferric-dicitrate binding protein FerR (iron transport regulator)
MKRQILFTILALVSAVLSAAHAAPLTGAKITYIVNDVRTVASGQAPRKSALDEFVAGGNAVRTGIESRTELLFNDQTITRLGANTHFTVNSGTREISLSQGTILLQVPKGSGGAKIKTNAVTAAITGTTIHLVAGPLFHTLTVHEGKCWISLNADPLHRMVAVTAGFQIKVANNAGEMPAPSEVDLAAAQKNSVMFTGEWGTELEKTALAVAIAMQFQRHSGEIGILKIIIGTALINREPAKNGAKIHSGDVIETGPNQTVIIVLNGGGEISLDNSTRLRIGGGGTRPITTHVVFGHITTIGLGAEDEDSSGADPLPFLAAFGFGNLAPGGSGSSASGRVLTVALPNGYIVFFDSAGNFIKFQ